MHELRCAKKLHGILDDGILEVKCNSRFCGAGEGIVVIHRFNTQTGELVSTNRFKDPERRPSAAHDNPAAVRSA
jgi:hypothetical protein